MMDPKKPESFDELTSGYVGRHWDRDNKWLHLHTMRRKTKSNHFIDSRGSKQRSKTILAKLREGWDASKGAKVSSSSVQNPYKNDPQ